MVEGRLIVSFRGNGDGKSPVFPYLCLLVVTFKILLDPICKIECFLNVGVYFVPHHIQRRRILIKNHVVPFFPYIPKYEAKS